MKKCFLFMLMFSWGFSVPTFAENFLEKDFLIQLDNLEDSCIISVKENKYYLNTERIYVVEDGIYLESDYFGPIFLFNIRQDNEGIYTMGMLYSYWRCNNCSALYRDHPRACKICGGTSFTPVEHLPPD